MTHCLLGWNQRQIHTILLLYVANALTTAMITSFASYRQRRTKHPRFTKNLSLPTFPIANDPPFKFGRILGQKQLSNKKIDVGMKSRFLSLKKLFREQETKKQETASRFTGTLNLDLSEVSWEGRENDYSFNRAY